MSFQVNLDACVLESISAYPYILGNLMLNDYIRGIDPLKADKRIVPQQYLSMYNDNLTNRERERHPKVDRTITQVTANAQGYATDPRGASLVYSKWLCKWYVGFGRIRNIFEGVFANIGRMKILLNQEGFDHSSVFTQKVEESVIRSFCRCLIPDAGAEDTAVDWYREALPHNKVHALELCADEHMFPQMDVESVSYVDPGTTVNHAGQTIPRFMNPSTYADNHAGVLATCFGEGHGNTLDEQAIGQVCQRLLQQSLALLYEHAKATTKGGKFNLQRTLIEEGDADETYSAVVCVGPYFHLDPSEFRSVQPNLAALPGIALLMTNKSFNNQSFQHNTRLKKIYEMYGGDVAVREGKSNWRNDVHWLGGGADGPLQVPQTPRVLRDAKPLCVCGLLR